MKFLSFYYVPVFHELIVSWDCGNWEVGSNHNGFHVFGGWALNSRSPTLLFNDRTFNKDFNFRFDLGFHDLNYLFEFAYAKQPTLILPFHSLNMYLATCCICKPLKRRRI